MALMKTPLTSFHVENNAAFVEFAGWKMPLHYGSITNEYGIVRERAGLFDVSHMGRFEVRGNELISEFQRLISRRLTGKPYGKVVYALVLNESGKILDDILVYLWGETRIGLVVNASNRIKLYAWFRNHLPGRIELIDRTLDTAMVALQGPAAMQLGAQLLSSDPCQLPFYGFDLTSSNPLLVSRTGYTGEDGIEVSGDSESILQFCRNAVIQGAFPAGLGARDILRLEMGYPLYGHEMDEETSPFQAGLSWAVDIDNRDFIGAERLRNEQVSSPSTYTTGLLMKGRGIPRQGCTVRCDGKDLGVVTSGGFSPTLKRGIALVRLTGAPDDHPHPRIVIRDQEQEAEWKAPPFVPDRTARRKMHSI